MTQLKEKIFQRINERKDEMIQLRRHFHQYPELSFHETKTAQTIAEFYQGKDCEVHTQVGGGNGIWVDITGGKPGKHLAIRADFDALPIQEETNLPFASKIPGVMHACGHDGHTAYMMILADTLIEFKDELPGTIRILHQPAEEVPPGGAQTMIKAGCLEGIDNVLGIHVMSTMDVGKVFYHEGAVHTGRATFSIKMHGKGGHGSAPQDANDAIVAAAQFVTSVQTIVSRRISPFDNATVTIGSFDGKGSANVIKETVELQGDVRMMNENLRPVIEKEFKQILDGICQAFNITYELNYLNDYPVCMNDPKMTQLVKNAVTEAKIPEVEGVEDSGPQTASEDFSYYALERPSCFFFVGAHEKGTPIYPHHNPNFQIDEDCLPIAAKSMASAVLAYLFEGVAK
ncbi:M20 family metallopeptidase [Candidatus Enterococcus ferrettii]|uniref:Peptidase M20 dimerisation domain-containing protein n=1 Tax=Candidatus Enterococcus ferrettii TaxID=2815324 RepID=A0ABV0ELN4_9ENTE|nr:M20 family metallopeptidase [Enterococcus sp. 665A]MBO1338214.1 amidohydrolase [Enterococcus sp. 665A]